MRCMLLRNYDSAEKHYSMTDPLLPTAYTSIPTSLRALAEFLVVGVCSMAFALTVLGITMLLLTGNSAGRRDSVSFWASGQQLAHHANPYDANAILHIERSVGYPASGQAFIMRNPPSALLLALPLGYMGLRAGALLWALALFACLLVSVRMLLRPKSKVLLLGYSFGPALACILAGQSSLFALLGLVLFLRLHRTRPFLAGIALWLCALKPHLFLPFGVVLLTWIVITKSYNILLGAALALATSSAIVYFFDPFAWSQYAEMMRTSGIQHEFIPCLSVAIRHNRTWVQYVPTLLACIWAVHYYWMRRDTWDWMEDGCLLMLVSIFTAPYAWFTDQALAIPALLQAAFLTRSQTILGVLALVSAVIDIEVLKGIPMHSALYLWTAPAWLIWYIYATRMSIDQGKATEIQIHPGEVQEA